MPSLDFKRSDRVSDLIHSEVATSEWIKSETLSERLKSKEGID